MLRLNDGVVRALVLALAVAAVGLAFLPSAHWLDRWPSWTGTWSGPVSLAIGNTTALLAAALAALLALRRNAHAGALPLALCLVAFAMGWGIMTGPSIPLQAAWVSTALIASAGAFVRFTFVYPHPLTAEAVHARVTAPAPRRGAHRDDPLGALFDAPDQIMMRWMLALLGPNRFQRVQRALHKIIHVADPVLDMNRVALGVLRIATNPWRLTLLTALLVIGLSVAEADAPWASAALAALIPTFIMMALLLATITARVGYLVADAQTRGRALWIMEGILAGFVLLMLGTASVILGSVLHAPQVFGLGPVGVALGALAFTLCLVVSVFFHGALDAGLMIRRTVFAGLFGILLAFLFAVIEQVMTTVIAERFALPSSAGLIVSSAIAAGVFGPLWQRVNAWVSARLPGESETAETA